MLDKKEVINFLYLISFPVYGIGAYIGATSNMAVGYVLSVGVHLLIFLFYLLDILYKKDFKLKINGLFFWMMLYMLSCVGAFFLAVSKNAPFINELYAYIRTLVVFVTYFSFIAVCLYNENSRDRLIDLTFNSLSLLLFINLVGYYVFGLTNGTHNIEGRLSLPFIDGMYSGACTIAILNLIILYYLKKSSDDPVRFSYLLGYFLLNLLFLFLINSRLANLIFLFVFLLSAFNFSHRFKGLFFIGVFFVPLLLNLGFLLYQILSLPFFKVLMQRVDLKDVTTFNGRAYVWERAIDWALYDQRSLIFGAGHDGHYFLHLIPDIAKLWGVPETSTHLHSSSLSVLVDQGVVGYFVLTWVCYKTYMYYKRKVDSKSKEGLLFPVMVFILIVMQVDAFVYRECTGALILSFLVATASLNGKNLFNSKQNYKTKLS